MIKTSKHNLSKLKHLLNTKMIKAVALILLCCHLFNVYYYNTLKYSQNIPDAELGYVRFPGKNWVYWLPCDSSSSMFINCNEIPLKADNEFRVFIFFNYFSWFEYSFGSGKQNIDLFCKEIRNHIEATIGKKCSIVISVQDQYFAFQFLKLTDYLITKINPNYSILVYLSYETPYVYPNITKEALSIQSKQYVCSLPIIWKLLFYLRPNYRYYDFRDITFASTAKRFNYSNNLLYFQCAKNAITSFSKKSPISIYFTFMEGRKRFDIQHSDNCYVSYIHYDHITKPLVIYCIKSTITKQKPYIINNN